MFIAPSTLALARARRHDLEREAHHERLLRAARAQLRASCCDVDAACCPAGRCVRVPDASAGPSPRDPGGAVRRPAWRRRAGGFAALLQRALPSPAAATTRCAPSCAAG